MTCGYILLQPQGPSSFQKSAGCMGVVGCPQPSSQLNPLPCPPRTSIAFIDADVKVAAEGGRVDDAVGNLVVGRGVFICCLEGMG